MSVLIKGMKIPSTCAKCVLRQAIECEKWKLVRCIELDKHKDCPLVSVPLHGRLIDADALEKEGPDIHETYGYFEESIWGFSHDMISDAPTIIEAEEE